MQSNRSLLVVQMANKQLSSVVQVKTTEILEEELLCAGVDASDSCTTLPDCALIEDVVEGEDEWVCQSSDNVRALCSAVQTEYVVMT